MFKILPAIILASAILLSGCSEPKQNVQPVKSEQVKASYEEGKHYRLVNNINVGDLKAPFSSQIKK